MEKNENGGQSRRKRNYEHLFWKIDVCLETDGHDYSVCYKKISDKNKVP